MATPDAVTRQDEESDKALQEFLGQAPAAEAPKPADEKLAPAPEPKPEDTPAPVEQEAAPEPDQKDQEIERLRKEIEAEKHRNDSLQGRVESQLRPMNDLVRDLRAQIQDLQTRVSGKEAEARGPAKTRHLRPEEVESIGKDAVDVQSRVAQGVAEDVVQGMTQSIEAKRQVMEERIAKLEADRAQSAAASLWDRVEELVPNAKKLNESDPRWFQFLDSVDPLSGRSRREIGSYAIQMGDVRRLAMLMTECYGEKSQAASGQVRPEVVQAAPPGQRRAMAPARPPMMKQSDISRFYNDWTRGKYRGREKDAVQIEKLIDAAVAEGRVVPG